MLPYILPFQKRNLQNITLLKQFSLLWVIF
jgi:hypothetical protein